MGEFFQYEPEGRLIRKQKTSDRGAGKIGEYVGGRSSEGYWIVSVKGKNIKMSAVIWAIHHGEWPKRLKHKDNDKNNLRIENLELR